MKEILLQLINDYGMTILTTILTTVASYVGLKIKSIYEAYATDRTKKSVVEDTVKYVEQIYKDLSGEEKLAIAIENAVEVLGQKGIEITVLELRILIESTCNSFKESLNKKESIETKEEN